MLFVPSFIVLSFLHQRRAQGRQHLRVGVDDSGPARVGIRGRRVLPGPALLAGVPLQAAQGDLPHAHLPLQHQQPGRHLPGHTQGQLEPRADRLQGAPLSLLAPHRLQPRYVLRHCQCHVDDLCTVFILFFLPVLITYKQEMLICVGQRI